MTLEKMVDRIVEKGFGFELLDCLKKKLQQAKWGQIKHLELSRMKDYALPLDQIQHLDDKKKLYQEKNRAKLLENIFVKYFQKTHPFAFGKFEPSIRNQMHPTLEELLEKFDKKKEVAKTNEEIKQDQKTLVRKIVDYFKGVMHIKNRRKLMKIF